MELKRWVENWNQSTEFLRHHFRFDRADFVVFTAGFLFSLPTLLQLEIAEPFFMFNENHIRLVGVEESKNLVHQYTVAFKLKNEAEEQKKGFNHHLSLPCLIEKLQKFDPSFRMNSRQKYSTEFNCFLLNKSLNLKQCPIKNMEHLTLCNKSSETVQKIHANSSLVRAFLQDFRTNGAEAVREHLSSLFNDVLLVLRSGLSMANNNMEILRDQKMPYILWLAGAFLGFKDQLKFDLTSLSMLDIDTLIVTSIFGMNNRVLAITFDYARATSTFFPFCLPIRGTVVNDKALVIEISLDTQPIFFRQVLSIPVCYNSLKHTVATVASGLDRIDKIDRVLQWVRESMSKNAAEKFEFFILGHLSAHVGNQNLDFSHLSASLLGSKNVLVYMQKDRRRRTDCFVLYLLDKTPKAENCSMVSAINLQCWWVLQKSAHVCFSNIFKQVTQEMHWCR